MQYQEKAALIGLGYWGKKIFLSLQKNFLKSDIFIVDTKYHNQKPGFNSMNWVLANQDIKYLFIATPEETHFKLAQQGLKSGKNVYVEKPLSLISRQTTALTSLALNSNLFLYCDYIFLFDPYLNEIKKYLQKANDSIISIISYRNSTSEHQKKISVTDDLAIHDIYIYRFLTGREIDQKDIQIKVNHHLAITTIVTNQKNSPSLTAYYSWKGETSIRNLLINTSQGKKITWDKTNQIVVKTQGKSFSLNIPESRSSPLDKSIDFFLNKCQQSSHHLKKKYLEYYQDTKILELLRL